MTKFPEPEFYVELKIKEHVVKAHTRTIVLGNYFEKRDGKIDKKKLAKSFMENTSNCVAAKIKRIRK